MNKEYATLYIMFGLGVLLIAFSITSIYKILPFFEGIITGTGFAMIMVSWVLIGLKKEDDENARVSSGK